MAIHPNARLIQRLYEALQRHDAKAMAECYCDDGVLFHDIAFHIDKKPRLDGMWRMICEGESDIKVEIKHVEADDRAGEASVVDTYWFGRDMNNQEPGVKVVNPITSRFRFRDGRIAEHKDDCDPVAWARQAIGGPRGWLAGRIRILRSSTARKKLDRFLEKPRATSSAPPSR